MFKKIIVFSFLFLFVVFKQGFCEKIYLMGGDVIEGKIVEQEEDHIRVDTGIGFYLTYYLDEIERIEGQEEIVVKEQMKKENTADASSQEKKDLLNKDPFKNNKDAKLPSPSDNLKIDKDLSSKTALQTPYSVGKKQEDYLFAIAQDPDAGKVERKWEENRYLDYQVERQVELQKDKISQMFFSLKDSMVAQAQVYFEKFQQDHPATYEKMIQVFDWTKDFSTKILEKAKTIPLYVFIIVGVVFYALFCYPLMLIGQKLGFAYAWIAWIPILNLFLMIKMAGASFLSFVFLFIPIIDIFVFISLWGKIIDYLQKPPILSILMILPGPNLLLIWFLALAKTK
ncbi:MAG TPA: hypothetical protein PKH98_02030 [Candidatus Omnitrophota bacterium]|nr:hypothetical protein [Candidatus Omnitrophota bacterium]